MASVLGERSEMKGGSFFAYMLKKMQLERKAAMKLEKMRFARGEWRIRRRGMMGRWTRDSIQRKVEKDMAAMEREAMTRG